MLKHTIYRIETRAQTNVIINPNLNIIYYILIDIILISYTFLIFNRRYNYIFFYFLNVS